MASDDAQDDNKGRCDYLAPIALQRPKTPRQDRGLDWVTRRCVWDAGHQPANAHLIEMPDGSYLHVDDPLSK